MGWNYYHYRTRNGAEIDLILEGAFGISPIEIKHGLKTDKSKSTFFRKFIKDNFIRLSLSPTCFIEFKLSDSKCALFQAKQFKTFCGTIYYCGAAQPDKKLRSFQKINESVGHWFGIFRSIYWCFFRPFKVPQENEALFPAAPGVCHIPYLCFP